MLLEVASQTFADKFGEALVIIILLVFFGIPTYFAWKSSKKGVSRDSAMLPCAECKLLIPARATRCPYCGSTEGHEIFTGQGKKLANNIKGNRFWSVFLWTLFGEFCVVLLIIVLIQTVFR